jgi:sulfur-oxidizing protein SoxZ
MGNPMKIRAKADGDIVEVRILMSHRMETGQRKSELGEVIAAHFIQTVTATYGERLVLAAQWGPAVSANPFLDFKFRGGVRGGKIKVTWTDNRGDSRTDEAVIN